MIPEPYRIEPLGKHHDRAAFSCGAEELDVYLRRFVSQDHRRNLTRCFVLVNRNQPERILGYYTLSNAAVARANDATDPVRSPYPEIPALLLGRLAVDESLQGRGWGRRLLLHVLLHAGRLSEESGFALILVDPIDDRAASFYARFGFKPLSGNERMYLRLKDIRKTFTRTK